MYFADYHVHSHFSGDSEMIMEHAVMRAVALGLNEIAFTDHVDYNYPDPSFFAIDYEQYQQALGDLQRRFRADIRIVFGVEIGFQPHVQTEIETLVASNPFDFVILSTHMADRLDFYTGDFFDGRDKKERYRRYFECLLEAVENYQNFDVYGHLDVIERYGTYPDRSLNPADYQDVIDLILQKIIAAGNGIEVNTSGLRYGLGHMHPSIDILKRYQALGGEILTIGSDAHSIEVLAYQLQAARELLSTLNFKYLCRYTMRKADFVKLW